MYSIGRQPSAAPTRGTEPELVPATPAPYGRACLSCARAKCKCLTRSGSKSCERCLRLGKECHPRGATRKRNITGTRLEEKVDGILSLLQSVNGSAKGADVKDLESRTPVEVASGANQITTVQRMLEQSTIVNGLDNSVEPTFIGSATPFTPSNTPSRGSNNIRIASTDVAFDTGKTFETTSSSVFLSSPDEAEKYWLIFRNQTLVNFAFIYLPASTTAQTLHQERPFLFLAIMAVTSHSRSRRLALGKEVKQLLARELLAENEGNFDVLLGLLVFLTWGHDQFVFPQLMSRFMHFAISVVFDLRLNKSPHKGPSTLFNLGCNQGEIGEASTPARRTEERRAVLGCYVLSSIISWYFKKTDPLRWTPYMDECLRILSTEPESPTDEIFTIQVRLQLIAEKVSQTTTNNAEFDQSEAPKAPLPFYLRALRSQLVDVKQILSLEAENNQILLAHIYHTEISINALALSKDTLITNSAGFERLDSLSRCLTSIKCWFEILFAIPPGDYFSNSFPFFTHIMHSIVILYRLSTFEDPAWDRNLVRETVDIVLILEQLISNFRLLKGHDTTMVFEWVKSWSQSKLTGDVTNTNGNSTIHSEETIDVPMDDTTMLNIMDDTWLSDMLGSWSYDF